MIDAQLSYFDAIVLGVMLLSCLFAFFRGFVKEILSLGAWIGAGLITLFYFKDVAKWLTPHFKSEMVAGGLATLGLYIVSLIAFSIVNGIIMRMMKEGGDIGILDNTLGLIFGAFRGAFILSLGYLILTIVMTEDSYPPWIKTAHSRPWVEKGAIVLGRIAPDYLVEHTSIAEKINEASGKAPEVKLKDNEGKQGSGNSGYNEEHSRSLDRFIDNLNRDSE